MLSIGIPRALQFFQSYPLWRTFFEKLGAKVVISPATNRSILSAGVQMVADVMCLPVKVYAGHVAWLRDHGHVDFVFVPAIRSVEWGALHCSKFQGLPDLIRAVMPNCPNLLTVEVDIHRYKISMPKAFYKLGRELGSGSLQIRRAWKQACKIDSDYQACLSAKKLTYAEALAQLYPTEWDGQKKLAVRNPTLNIALVGHPYCLYDNYINHDLITELRQLGVCVHTSEMVSLEEAKSGIDLTTGQTRWFYENWMSGAAGSYLMDPKIDGVISVMAFTCGPDSVMVDTISRRAHALKRPFMNLVLDEHGSSAGMITRLEAFVDMLNRPRAAQAAAGEITSTTSKPAIPPAEMSPQRRFTPPNVLKVIHQPRIGIPRMGSSVVPLKSLFTGIGAQVEFGPRLSSRTVSLGVRYSPEFICTPYKFILGNMIEMLEAGANTLLYMDGAELCRNSSYTQLLNETLQDIGYKFHFVSTAVFEKGGLFALPKFLSQFMEKYSLSQVIAQIYLAITKMNVLDEIERFLQYLRPREVEQGRADKLWEEANIRMEETADPETTKMLGQDILQKMKRVEIDPGLQPVKIATTGEYYAVLEPFFNLDLERVLGRLGAEVHRTLMLGDWVKVNMILEALGFQKSEINRAAKPYLRWNIGGEGLVTVGQAVIQAQKGIDGIVELLPFTCLPEITIMNILPRISRDLKVPIIPFILDEQSGQAGMRTRLEAFVDLLYRRRNLHSSLA